MMNINGYISDNEVENANGLKECICSAMITEKFLTPERAKEFCENYTVIFRKKNMFGKILDAVCPLLKDDVTYWVVVKVIKNDE